MSTGQPDKYIATVIAFGDRSTISAGAARYLAAPGGTGLASELSIIVPRDGTLKNLYWNCESIAAGIAGGNITVMVNGSATVLKSTWTGSGVKSGNDLANTIPVLAGQRVGVQIQLSGSGNMTRPRVSVELERDSSSPWVHNGSDFYYDGGGNVGIGIDTPGEKLTVDGFVEADGIKFPDGSTLSSAPAGVGIIPIGSIIAWNKNFPNTPAIPDSWVECNGQTLNDPASVYHGQTIPNINADTGTGNGGMFLRGNSTSGIVQSDQMQDHKHNDMGHSHVVNNVVDGTLVICNAGNPWGGLTEPNNATDRGTTVGYANLTGPTANNSLSMPRVGLETRPVNFSVVWIMRVK